MIEFAPVQLIRDDPVYKVLPVNLEVLTAAPEAPPPTLKEEDLPF